MIANTVQQVTFSFLAAANEGQHRTPAAGAADQHRAQRAQPGRGHARSLRPVQVTLHCHERVRGAREQPVHGVLEAAVRAAAAAVSHGPDFHVFHASVRSDRVYLLIQAQTQETLAGGVRAFSAAMTRRVNRALRRLGPVVAEEYAVQVLPVAAEFSHALRFLIGHDEPRARRGVRHP